MAGFQPPRRPLAPFRSHSCSVKELRERNAQWVAGHVLLIYIISVVSKLTTFFDLDSIVNELTTDSREATACLLKWLLLLLAPDLHYYERRQRGCWQAATITVAAAAKGMGPAAHVTIWNEFIYLFVQSSARYLDKSFMFTVVIVVLHWRHHRPQRRPCSCHFCGCSWQLQLLQYLYCSWCSGDVVADGFASNCATYDSGCSERRRQTSVINRNSRRGPGNGSRTIVEPCCYGRR